MSDRTPSPGEERATGSTMIRVVDRIDGDRTGDAQEQPEHVGRSEEPMTTKPLIAAGTALTLAFVIGAAMVGPVKPVCAGTPEVSYAEDVYPIFKGRCIQCHQPSGPGFAKSGLDLTTYEGLMKGTKFGPMVIPGDPETSNLMWLLDWRASPELRMPHGKKKLSTCDRDAIRAWIRQGAKNN
jgi:mono/diheme cytochrome c family protein